MYKYIVFLFLFVYNVSFSHKGDFILIENVNIEDNYNHYEYQFDILNKVEMEFKNVHFEFHLNGKKIDEKIYSLIKSDQKVIKEKFIISKSLFDINKDTIQIEITEIFGRQGDWGGWDSYQNHDVDRQVNTLGAEIYADAPWRMKKTDDFGNINSIPIHYFVHDGDGIGGDVDIEYIDIRIKNASDPSFSNVLTYNLYTQQAFENLFTSKSPTDVNLNIQGFDFSVMDKSSTHTIDFIDQTDWWGDTYYSVDKTYYYFTFNIPATDLVGFEDVIDIEIYSAVSFSTDSYSRLRIFRSDEDIPTLPNYYRGDCHLHSMYTQNSAEVGLPLAGTKEAAKLIGLDWITSTDHTSDYDNYGVSISSNWNRIKSETQQFNQEDPSLIFIAGQEVAANNAQNDLIHFLAYPNRNDPTDLPFLSDGNGDLTATTASVKSVVDQLYAIDGFAYAAHPFATNDKLPTVPVGGGIWNLGHAGFPSNTSSFPKTGGQIICNDPNAESDIFHIDQNDKKLVKDAIKGAQIWNLRNILTTSGDQNDPWNTDNSTTPFALEDTNSYGHHYVRFRQGQEVINFINQLGLKKKNEDDEYQNWKMYYAAGSDAHGSFNYTNTSDFGGFGDISDNAVGKLNVVAYCPNGMGNNGINVLNAMYNGNTTISDGPLVVTGISTNGNNASNEVLMGEDVILDSTKLEQLFLNITYKSSQEFGTIQYLKLIVGTENDEFEKIITTSPLSGSVSLNLYNELIDILGQNNIQLSDYVYVRTELRTFRDLSSQSATYKRNYDIFHSFSNPIWFKFGAATIEDITDDLSLDVYPNPHVKDFSLIIKYKGEHDYKITMYDNNGKSVYNQSMNDIVDATQLNINSTLFASGNYIIKVIADKKITQSIKVVKR